MIVRNTAALMATTRTPNLMLPLAGNITFVYGLRTGRGIAANYADYANGALKILDAPFA